MVSLSPVRPTSSRLPAVLPRLSATAIRTPALVALVVLVFGSHFVLGPELVLVLAAVLGLAVYRLSPPGAGARVWAIYLVAILLFSYLRAAADDIGPRAQLQYPLSGDRALFGGILPTLWLQEHLYQPGRFSLVEWAAVTMHFTLFVLPHTVGLLLWRLDPVRFRRYVTALILTLVIATAVSAAVPTAPPWMAAEAGRTPPISRLLIASIEARGGSIEHAAKSAASENPVAAMPSVHLAAAVLIAFAAWRGAWPLRLLGLGYVLAMAFALVYLGEHYVVDLLAGAFVAALALRLTTRLQRRVTAPASASPAPAGGPHSAASTATNAAAAHM